MRQDIKNNIKKILSGEIKITFVPAFRIHLKQENIIKYECFECKNQGEWNGTKLLLELDHIDGNKHNNIKENLRWLCPNCHSQTSTFRIKNYKNINLPKRRWIKEENIIESIKLGGSIAEILRRIGLKAVGDNYNRIHRICIKHKMEVPKGVVSTLEKCEGSNDL